MIYTGRMITADEALQIGLVKKVVYPDQEVTKETQMHDKNNANNKSHPGDSGVSNLRIAN